MTTYGEIAGTLGFASVEDMQKRLAYDVTMTRKPDEEISEERAKHVRWLYDMTPGARTR